MAPPSKNKKYILLGISAVLVVILVVSLVFSSGSNKESSGLTQQYQLENTLFSYALPVDFEPTSSTRESITATYIGTNEILKSSEVKITRYLQKDSTNDTPEKLKSILFKTPYGSNKKEYVTSESKTKQSKPILKVSLAKSETEATTYLINTGYIWKIEAKTQSKDALSNLQKSIGLIIEGIAEK